MSISVGKNLKELAKMAEKYSVDIVPSGKNGRIMKEDYILPFREYFLLKRYNSLDNIPSALSLMLQLKSPMLAMRIDNLKPDEQEDIWTNPDIYFEEKLNGARMLIIKDSSGLHVFSRHNSDTDFLPIEYTEHILFPDNFDLGKVKDDFIIDTEMTSDTTRLNTAIEKYGVTTESMLQAVTALLSSDVSRARMIQERENIRLTFNAFDCIYYNGQWILEEPLKTRRKLGLEIWKNLYRAGFKIRPVKSSISNKEAFYKGIILGGGEGIIAKDINGIYNPDTNRKVDGWIKIKRSVSEMASMDDTLGGMGDTIDGWISGFEPGTADKGLADYVGTIKVSTYLRKDDGSLFEHEIAYISGMDMKTREDMTDRIDGKPYLKAEYYNRVVEIDGAGISSRARRFQHSVLKSFIYDKPKSLCIMDESFINKMIL